MHAETRGSNHGPSDLAISGKLDTFYGMQQEYGINLPCDLSETR